MDIRNQISVWNRRHLSNRPTRDFEIVPTELESGAQMMVVDIGRPYILGNPYTSKASRLESWTAYGVTLQVTPVASADEAVAKFHSHLQTHWRQRTNVRVALENIADFCAEHPDNHVMLVCWCAPAPCHGNVIKYAVERILSARSLAQSAE